LTLTLTVKVVPATEAGLVSPIVPLIVKAPVLVTWDEVPRTVSLRLGGFTSTPKFVVDRVVTLPAASVAWMTRL
jgi:hypothetical protein